MGAWGKMMTAPGFTPGAPYSLPKYPQDKEDKSLDSSGNHDDVGSYKEMSNEDEVVNTSDLESELISEAEEELALVSALTAHARTSSSLLTGQNDTGKQSPKAATSSSPLETQTHKGSDDEKQNNEADSEKQQREGVEHVLKSERGESDDDLRDMDDEDDDLALSPSSEIKSRPPRGLLEQHGLSVKQESGGKSKADRFPGQFHMDFTHPSYLERQFSHPASSMSPPMYGEQLGASPAGHHWTFEEQFKQLYEMSDDPKRREFLDDLFAFMQKRGTPVNRIPIMAKQPLDLYELFRLVVSKGGLVEVINKKLWREICKGLNLPSSITSAAFTLRTQYMKYLYPYECEKLKLSNPCDLQSAIDGNRREGRRPGGFPPFDYPIPTMMSPNPHGPVPPGLMGNSRSLLDFPFSDEDKLPGPPPHLRGLIERDREHQIRAMQAAHQVIEQAKKRMDEAVRSAAPPQMPPLNKPLNAPHSCHSNGPICSPHPATSKSDIDGPPPAKRPHIDPEIRERMERFFPPQMPMPSAHIKISNRNDGRPEFDSSMVVSMEINGIMYQGVLFAQHPRRL